MVDLHHPNLLACFPNRLTELAFLVSSHLQGGVVIAAWEHQLLSRIVLSGDITTPQQWGITVDDFQTGEGKRMYQEILAYNQMLDTKGSVLGPNSLQKYYSTYQLVDDPNVTIEALCLETRKARVRADIRRILRESENLVESDPQAALSYMQAGSQYLQALGTSRCVDVPADEAMARIMQRYSWKEQGVDLSICPWPWHPLQEATGGMEPSDYVVIYGRPKSMKSWVLSYLMAWCWRNGKKLLVYTKEMTADNIYMRFAAIVAGLRYQEFRNARLNEAERAAIQYMWRVIHDQQKIQPMYCLSGQDTVDGVDSVPWLRSKIETYKPDICLVDGMYLMSDVRGPKKQKDNFRVQNISRDLRRIPLDMGVPTIVTIQATRSAAAHTDANLDEIAFSDAVAQDATLAMRVIKEKGQGTLALAIAGSREFELDGFRIHGKPAYCFDYAGPLSSAEVQGAIAGDVDPATTPQARKAQARRQNSGGQSALTADQANLLDSTYQQVVGAYAGHGSS